MRKLIWTLVILVVVGVFGGRAWYLYQHRETDTNVVKIGVILPLTGLVSETADEVQNGLNLAIEELNQRYDKKIKLLMEDGKYTEKDSINALHKIMTKDVSALMIMGQLPAMGTGPLIKDYNLPTMVTIAMGNKIPLFDEHIFRFYTPAWAIGEKIANYARDGLNLDKVGVFYIKNDMGRDTTNQFQKTFQDKGGKITSVDTFELGSMNMRSQVAKMLAGNPQAIYVAGFGPGFCATINAIKESGYEGYILSGGEILQPAYRNNIKDVNGIYFVDTVFDNYSDNERILAFSKKYREKYHIEPGNFAAFNYEAMLILGDAIQQKDIQTLDYLKKQIKNRQTIFGKISFDENGEIDIPLVIKQMQPDGTAKVVKE